MNFVNDVMSSVCFFASSAPVRTWASDGRIGLISETSCSEVVPSLAETEMPS